MKNRCMLCGEIISSKNKVKSHALSKSVYSGNMGIDCGDHIISMYAKDGLVVEGDYGHGETERNILCRKCDSDLSLFESERHRFLQENKNIGLSGNNFKKFLNYDWEKTKLAFLADIFRCSCFKGDYYVGVDIGEWHTARIASMLRGGDAGEVDDYTIWIVKYEADDLCDGAMMCPIRRKFGGLTYYVCLMPAGWMWIIKMDSRSSDMDGMASLSPSGIVVYNGGKFRDSGLFSAMVNVVRRNEEQKNRRTAAF